MNQGAITSSIDIAQVTLYLFWFFFAGLLYYLRREDKREGYPLEEANPGSRKSIDGFPGRPTQKIFTLPHGGTRIRPEIGPDDANKSLDTAPTAWWTSAPIDPTGNPMLAGVGPGAWADRPDHAELTVEGLPKIVPLRADAAYSLDRRDPDPRGNPVLGADGAVGGTIVDIWVDRSERLFRYLEVEVAGGRHVLLPVNFTKITNRGTVNVRSILGSHFTDVPGLRNPEQVTMLEEEKIMAYYGAGTLYAKPSRLGPLL
ncbi:MAG: photosynthetic reaction center subunit H [Dokdonella sp.]|uniref:photosynthetic reaction center subunit H n=1 Tax=Dokdonella sp. TaxID=2291710 RepID=UPI003263C703